MAEEAELTGVEAFLLEYSPDESILYSPLAKRLLLLSAEAAAELASDCAGGCDGPTRHALRKVLSEERLVIKRQADAMQRNSFAPTTLGLALTLDCNLSCVYCHAEAGAKQAYADQTMLLEAIEFFLDRALAAGKRHVVLSFAGGGEPTLAWDALVRCVERFERRTAELGVTHDIEMATNGTLSQAQCDL